MQMEIKDKWPHINPSTRGRGTPSENISDKKKFEKIRKNTWSNDREVK